MLIWSMRTPSAKRREGCRRRNSGAGDKKDESDSQSHEVGYTIDPAGSAALLGLQAA